MKRGRKKQRRERMIMIGSSLFVLTALTMTGIYVKDKAPIALKNFFSKSIEENLENTKLRLQEIIPIL